MTLPTTFNPAEIEARWYEHWETNGCFRPERPDAEAFTIVNPPPNVTGSLHIGHALDNTLQDIVIRYERLRGKDALWVVGMDHAGIATQMVVERQLETRQDKRTNYTREEFVEKVWQWKEESGGSITGQLRRLGCSMDWSREQFTMDPHFTKAVTRVFVDLYNDGLIYRDKRLVNWDPKLRTAISDLEVEQQTISGNFWHFKYPLEDGVTLDDGRDYIEVATTRPETMLADMAVAVHPEDERYASVVGKHVILPITGRRVPIVADEHADPELGSGAVKITPGHDFNDFEVGKRAGIAPADMLNMFDGDANVVQTADGLIPQEFIGLHRFRREKVASEEKGARELVVERMKELGCLIPHVAKTKKGEEVEMDAEPRQIATPFGDRGGVVIEPWLTDQWYVDVEKLAKRPIEAVRSGEVEIVPASWEKTFFNWMENILPWCISRQLWWGHRIPAWFSLDGEVFVAETYEEAQAQAGEGVALQQDADVLDTWFSSALWPFATLGWPDKTDLFEKHYPNSLLISGFDILFFWDARMLMWGYYNTGERPWDRLYLHGLVRAPDGQKMSKSKGNVVDPLGLIDQYGADALRFFMAAMESQGRDIKMDEKRIEGYRNFATKLWNAARFCQSNGIGASGSVKAPTARLAANQWIIGEVAETARAIEKAMEDLRFDAAASAIYHFVWDRFCDWYLELIKPVFGEGADPDAMPAVETREVAGWALDQILVMLHPFMPFITEELWHSQAELAGAKRPYELIVAKWPEPDAEVSKAATDAIDWVIDLTTNVRSAKNELGIAPGAKLAAFVPSPSDLAASTIERSSAAIERLARLTPVTLGEAPQGPAMQVTAQAGSEGADVFVIPLEGIIDIEAEKARLAKALEASRKEAKSLEGRLGNPNFVEKAKPEAVEKAREDHAHHTSEIERLEAALARLG
ncbi:valyl-tRNA synthetase [Erythrobacter litoralis]|uniref:Valine--tRNA ligase n=1 Tax=Erythrobacter litoralis TaxID=39960 RepID=A0A074N5R9_9SPHN|nr:valine--tRNA ligase [Erythrobacter litoralis]AOL24433.1 valyl-tRNA synthetase [Erythrobacter litoralis]KEO93327.1 valyl-tRNA synthetase [Erythrobacter litoralis]